jgi:flagellar assembly protein FliH
MGAATKFLFDVDFAKGADIRHSDSAVALAEHQRMLAAAETEAYRKGLAAAEAQAKSEVERRIATALERAAAALEALSRNLAGIEARLETEAVEVAVAVARKLAPELIAREPFAEIAALTSECFRQLTTTPHVVVRLNDALYDSARGQLTELAKMHGFDGRLVVLADPDMAPGDCRIEWADGGVDRERAKADAAINEAVGRYVAARLANTDNESSGRQP